MKITPSDNDNGRKVLQIEAAWNEIESDYNDMLDTYSQVQLPGFRPGKIPRIVIEQRFQREIVRDLSQRAAHRLGRKAVREAGEESLGPVEATAIECEKGKPFRFNVRFHPMPEIHLPDYDLLKAGDESTAPLDQLSRKLLDLVQFDIPDELVRAELALDDAEDSAPSREEWNAAAERIRLMLILKKIARMEGIGVDATDIERRIREKALDFGTKADRLRAELEKGGGLQRLKDMLLAESTLGYLMERTTE